jgi:hypothetical protein
LFIAIFLNSIQAELEEKAIVAIISIPICYFFQGLKTNSNNFEDIL